MKMYLSAFLPLLILLALVGCSKEQFGSVPQSELSSVDGLKSFEQLSCSTFTLIKPKVDILYVVDNSTSTYYVGNDVKTAIANTVNSVSSQFDFRIIGTPLIETASGNNDYQVLTNSQDSLGSAASHKIISASEFNFFATTANGAEKGLSRVQSFMNAHISDGLFRKQAYTLIVLMSNGRDTDIETDAGFGNGETNQNATVYNSRKAGFASIKSSLAAQQLRFISVAAQTNCNSGWLGSKKSYIQMSKDVYGVSGATDQGGLQWPDNYDLCGGSVSTIFASVNNSIKQVVIPHQYRYAPITFAENNETVSIGEVQVYKQTGNSSPVLMPNTEWSYENRNPAQNVNTRELPSAGEPVNGSHFVRFVNLLVYPDCVIVKSKSRTEYFNYIVLPKEPKPETIVVRVNGSPIAQSSSNGWTYVGSKLNQNIKAAYPNPGDETPAVNKSGFMIQLNGSANYYKSGDSVEVYYLPAGI